MRLSEVQQISDDVDEFRIGVVKEATPCILYGMTCARSKCTFDLLMRARVRFSLVHVEDV